MSTIKNPYNPSIPQGPEMPQQTRLPMRWRRPMRRVAQDLIPNWLTKRAIVAYILALGIVTITYQTYCLPWYYMLSGVVSIMAFFIYGSNVAKRTSVIKMHSQKSFEKRIFLIAFIPRLIWTILIYYIFMQNYGDAFGFENMDAVYYDDLGRFIAGLINEGNFNFYDEISRHTNNDDIADMGYSVYVGFIYWLTGNSIIVVRLIKCLLSALTVLLIYRLAKRNFGEQTARITAIFCTLWPNFWYYCGVHLKETEMVFLAVLFIEQTDQMLRSRQFTAWKVIPVLLIAAIIFTFRTPLGMVAILSLLFAVVMSSKRVVSWWKRIIVGLLAITLIGVIAGNRLEEKARYLMENQSEQQESSIKWYASRMDKGGTRQSFAKYASAAVFAPLIFTIPFPTMVRPFEGQELQQMLNGGNFTKNILSGFTIFALFVLLLSGRWREHLLPLSFMVGYLAVLALSSFAHSERFHQPVMPFEFMFMAYGLSVAVIKLKYRRWFIYWSWLMLIAAIAWNWFKLAGRGLV